MAAAPWHGSLGNGDVRHPPQSMTSDLLPGKVSAATAVQSVCSVCPVMCCCAVCCGIFRLACCLPACCACCHDRRCLLAGFVPALACAPAPRNMLCAFQHWQHCAVRYGRECLVAVACPCALILCVSCLHVPGTMSPATLMMRQGPLQW